MLSWATHMSNYLSTVEEDKALPIAVSYLSEGAHEWWIVFKETEEGKKVHTWKDLKSALASRFETLNKEKVARDKLAKWKQLKDVVSFNEDFQRILLDIPNISNDEQIDRYTRALKPYIFKEICTREYEKLADAMRDAERVESAYKRVSGKQPGKHMKDFKNNEKEKPVPMDIGNIQEAPRIPKLTPQERERCIREGLCLRCRQ